MKGKIRKLAHVIAVGGTLAIGWAVSDRGQQIIGAVVHAYPKLSFLTGALAFVATVYFRSHTSGS